MVKSTIRPKGSKSFIALSLFAAIVLVSFASCKHQKEGCGAYGNGGFRSFKTKKHHHHAMVMEKADQKA